MLSFVLAESALELVPREVAGSPAVASDSKRRGKRGTEILLDRSFHHSAMLRLEDSEKRGRPDLVHTALLSVTGTPLYLDGKVKVFVHCRSGVVLELAEKTRIPKNYIRFRGLMEETLARRPREGLIVALQAGVKELVRRRIGADFVLGMSVQGRGSTFEEAARMVTGARTPCLLVGGFPHGHFSKETLGATDALVRVDSRPLEAHVVASRAIYEVEKAWKKLND